MTDDKVDRREAVRRAIALGLPVVLATVTARRVDAQASQLSAGCGSLQPTAGLGCAPTVDLLADRKLPRV